VRQAGKFRFVTDCLQHALVARGRLHAAVDTIMHPWDVAALVPCVREAGGVAQPLAPGADDVVFGGSLVTTGSEALLHEVCSVLQPAADHASSREDGNAGTRSERSAGLGGT
jgi:histidinol-phosphatase